GPEGRGGGAAARTAGVRAARPDIAQPATSLFSGTNWLAVNVAPCGSRSTVSREYGASIGGTTTWPPSSVAFRAAASASSTPKVTPQWPGGPGPLRGTGFRAPP